jgi:dihydroorotate dehydrogenase (NAD+) catalytic subunit
LESYVKATDMAEKTDVPMIELNISCPNVKAGGQAWGMNPDAAFECVSAVRAHTKKVLMVKLSPNAPDLRAVAMACVRAGADALSLVNTFSSTAIDIETGHPFFNNIRAGYCGPAIKPIALRMVYDVAEEMNKLPPEKRVPIVGLGGIEKWQDAVEFIMAGSCAVQVGSANFVNPDVAEEIVTGLRDFMRRKGYRSIADFCGLAHNQQ